MYVLKAKQSLFKVQMYNFVLLRCHRGVLTRYGMRVDFLYRTFDFIFLIMSIVYCIHMFYRCICYSWSTLVTSFDCNNKIR